MKKYYTRACNFYYNRTSIEKVKKKISLPVSGNKSLSFDTIEIITRTNKNKINIRNIKNLPPKIKKKVLIDINNISKVKKIPKLKFDNLPILMGVLNITPDSFSDGGKFNKKISAIICSTEFSALSAIKACNHLKYKIGKDISIITFDGALVRDLSSPPITAVSFPVKEL